MISAKVLFSNAEKLITDNAPAILTAVGAVGTVGAVVLASKASLKASRKIVAEEAAVWQQSPSIEFADPQPLPVKDQVKLVWVDYLPAAGLTVVSVTCIVFANRINTKRAAALAAAYSLSERAFGEYRDKIVEKFNPTKEQQVRDEIAQDRINANPEKTGQVILIGAGDIKCYDQPSDRYFTSTHERIRQVENEINASVNEVGEASLEEFYAALKLDPTVMSDFVGWTTDTMLKVQFSSVLDANGVPCLVINYRTKLLRPERFQGSINEPPF